MFKENWMNELEFYDSTIPVAMTILEFLNKKIIVPNVSLLVVKLQTYINGHGLIFGTYIEDFDFIIKIAELPISADEFETIKTNCTKLDDKEFRQMIKNKFNLNVTVWPVEDSFEIQFDFENRYQDNHFDCIQIMQDVFNQIAS